MRLLRAFVLAIFIVFLGTTALADEPKKEIEATFNAFASALVEKDGKSAADLVTASSLKWLEQLREDALHADEDSVRKMPFGSKKGVLFLRQHFTKEQLKKMTGKELAAFCVKKEMIDFAFALLFKLGDGRVTQETGALSLQGLSPTHLKGKLKTLTLQFKKENGKWRIELEPVSKVEEAMIENVLNDELARQKLGIGQINLDELMEISIKARIEKTSGREMKPDIWQPLVPKP